MALQAKAHSIASNQDLLACDKGTAILGIKEIVEELVKQDKKLTSLKTLQVHRLSSALISAKFVLPSLTRSLTHSLTHSPLFVLES